MVVATGEFDQDTRDAATREGSDILRWVVPVSGFYHRTAFPGRASHYRATPGSQDDMAYSRRQTKLILAGMLRLALCGQILHGAAHAADTPEAAPVTLPPEQGAKSATDPASLLNAMADHLDTDPGQELMRLDNLPITHADIAGVIRSMPPLMGNQPYQTVYARAVDIMIRQKAMVRRAQMENLDKDPIVAHKAAVASELVLADAWLRRRANAAVTEEALHARYDQEIAGKPGPDEVRARVIRVPSEADARLLIRLLQNGADFAEMAHAQSKDPTAANGGDIGYVTRQAVPLEVSLVIFALAPGQITAYPVPWSLGYLIIRVEGRRNRAPLMFEEARPQLEREIREEATKEATGSLLANIKVVRPETSPDNPKGKPVQPAKP